MEEKIIKGINLCIRSIAFRLINLSSGFKGEKWRILEEDLILSASQDCMADFKKSLKKIIEYSREEYADKMPLKVISRLIDISEEVKNFNEIEGAFVFESKHEFVTQEAIIDNEKFSIFHRLKLLDEQLRSLK